MSEKKVCRYLKIETRPSEKLFCVHKTKKPIKPN